jgi:tryptophanyl-tRNA synthetase
MKTVFSGLQPSGNIHIGNYIGAIRQWVKLQEDRDAIYCIVDLHAITVPQDPKVLKEKTLEVAALYLACGLDPKKANIFVQSENPDHPYLAWILNCITPFGQLERMTQFKEKAEKHEENVGLFDYPALMAADILLYQTDEVPVGEDQKQHIELARDLAEKFNSRFGQTFKIPEPLIQKQTARIMGLQNAFAKMSKSDIDPMGTINLLDSEEEIRTKVKKAITDSDSSVSEKHGKQHGAIANLLTIYSAFSGLSLDESLDKFNGTSYSEFKQALADLLVEKLKPIQERYQSIREDENGLREVLAQGLKNVREKSAKTTEEVKAKVGLS